MNNFDKVRFIFEYIGDGYNKEIKIGDAEVKTITELKDRQPGWSKYTTSYKFQDKFNIPFKEFTFEGGIGEIKITCQNPNNAQIFTHNDKLGKFDKTGNFGTSKDYLLPISCLNGDEYIVEYYGEEATLEVTYYLYLPFNEDELYPIPTGYYSLYRPNLVLLVIVKIGPSIVYNLNKTEMINKEYEELKETIRSSKILGSLFYAFVHVYKITIEDGEIKVYFKNFDKMMLNVQNSKFNVDDKFIQYNSHDLCLSRNAIEKDEKEQYYKFVLLDFQHENCSILEEQFYLIKELKQKHTDLELFTGTLHTFLCMDNNLTTFFELEIGRDDENIVLRRREFLNYDVQSLNNEPSNIITLFDHHSPTNYQEFVKKFPGEKVILCIIGKPEPPSMSDFIDKDGCYAFHDGSQILTKPVQVYFHFPIEKLEKAKKILTDSEYRFYER